MKAKKLLCYIFLFSFSFGSYAAILGSCTEKPFEFSDLKELQKDELITDYCDCMRIGKVTEDAKKESSDKAEEFEKAGNLKWALRYLEQSREYINQYGMSYRNADRIKRILGSKYKYKKEPKCEK